MKRAPIVEDWSRFNRAVLDVADGVPQRPTPTRQQPVPQPPRREPPDLASEPGTIRDTYGLLARQNWRKHA